MDQLSSSARKDTQHASSARIEPAVFRFHEATIGLTVYHQVLEDAVC